MDKKQMAEWLAECVLGCTYCKDCDVWVSDTVKYDIVKFIYSPDGFFAVWDAVEKKFPFPTIEFYIAHNMTVCCGFTHDVKKDYWDVHEFGKDRYEAFYNAVYEARGYEVKRDILELKN